jgi:hypothetical protein
MTIIPSHNIIMTRTGGNLIFPTSSTAVIIRIILLFQNIILSSCVPAVHVSRFTKRTTINKKKTTRCLRILILWIILLSTWVYRMCIGTYTISTIFRPREYLHLRRHQNKKSSCCSKSTPYSNMLILLFYYGLYINVLLAD